MRRFSLTYLIILMVLCFTAVSAVVAADMETETVLRKIEKSETKYTYIAKGVTTFRYGRRMVSSDITLYHNNSGDSRLEYQSPPLKGVVAVNSGDISWRFDPKLDRTVVAKRNPNDSIARKLKLLLKSCHVSVTDGGKVGNIPSVLVEVRTRRGVLRKRLWADRKTYVVLHSQDYNNRGILLSSTKFSSIKYVDSIPYSKFEIPEEDFPFETSRISAKPMSFDQLCKAVGFDVTVPRYIPRGYQPDGYRLYECPRRGRKAAFTRYTNGLDGISIFEMRRPNAHKGKLRNIFKPCLVKQTPRGQVAVSTSRGRVFIVIANLNKREMKRISEGLK